MDMAAISSLSGLTGTSALKGIGADGVTGTSSLTGVLTDKSNKADGTLFEAFFNSAIDNIKTTNSYLSDKENEEIKFAMGETENTHDLTIALQKASTALQYTVAIRDKVLEAYRELMQIQI